MTPTKADDGLLPADIFDPTQEKNWHFHDEYEFWYIEFPEDRSVVVNGRVIDPTRERRFKPWEHIARPTPAVSSTDGERMEALEYFKPPFKYESLGQTIYCEGVNGNQMALQVRGWGNLTGGGANALSPDTAAQIQDAFGEWVVAAMNADLTTPSNTDAQVGEDVRENVAKKINSIIFGEDTKEAWANCHAAADALIAGGFIRAAESASKMVGAE